MIETIKIKTYNESNEPFVYHYQKPELIISKEDWLDMYSERSANKEKLYECLNKDIKYFDKYTPKQKEIVNDLLLCCIPYTQCIETINNSFWTTKTLQNACSKLKKAYL